MTLYNIIHGAEFWLALAIFNIGAAWGLLMGMLVWLYDRRRKNGK